MTDRDSSLEVAEGLFARPIERRNGVWVAADGPTKSEDEQQTNSAFSEKWMTLEQAPDDTEAWKHVQYKWYLQCYGFESEDELAAFLKGRRLILDAGCGPGHKAAWFARLAPESTVVAMDLTDSTALAARRYQHLPNLIVVKGNIAETPFRDALFDFISCDQVLHHTDSPPDTVREFNRILSTEGVLNTYVYARKSMPRELIDEHFRSHAKTLTMDQIWELSDQLTQLGRTLAHLKAEIDVPDIPALDIRGGRMDLQRFIHWNFLKCFWSDELGHDASKLINFDWYSPSTAFRYSRDEFVALLSGGGFREEFLHSEEACHTGRFRKKTA